MGTNSSKRILLYIDFVLRRPPSLLLPSLRKEEMPRGNDETVNETSTICHARLEVAYAREESFEQAGVSPVCCSAFYVGRSRYEGPAQGDEARLCWWCV